MVGWVCTLYLENLYGRNPLTATKSTQGALIEFASTKNF